MRFTLWAAGLFCLVGFVSSRLVSSVEEYRQPNISIVGGTPAVAGEFPALGALRLSSGKLHCGGTLIGRSHVLTAAHCLMDMSASIIRSLTMVFNTLTVSGSTGSVTRNVKNAILHENFVRRTWENDVAVIVLSSPVTTIALTPLPTDPAALTTKKPTTVRTTARPTTRRPTTRRPTTKPSCSCTCPPRAGKQEVAAKAEALDSRAFSSYANATAVIAGWGRISTGGSNPATLLKASITVHSNSVCSKQYGSGFYPVLMLCASAPGKDTCQGDSGGPLYVNGVQVGITSWGRACADPTSAGVYARVTTYVDWIAKTVANNPA